MQETARVRKMLNLKKPAFWPKALAGLIMLLVLVVAGCKSTGSYPVEVFNEMHYQPAAQSQEPPRLLPPEGSVPITGREVAYTISEAKLVANPLKPAGQEIKRGKANLEAGAELYDINCSVCHGPLAKGDGNAGVILRALGYAPADLTVDPTRSRTDGEIYNIITNGGAAIGTQVMPPFKNLLTMDARWAIILYMRELQKGQ